MVRIEWHKRSIAARKRSELPALTDADLNPNLVEDLDCLLDDAVAHLEWLCVWCVVGCAENYKFCWKDMKCMFYYNEYLRPNVVQAVRSLDDSAIASDLTWDESQGSSDFYYSKPAQTPQWIYNQ